MPDPDPMTVGLSGASFAVGRTVYKDGRSGEIVRDESEPMIGWTLGVPEPYLIRWSDGTASWHGARALSVGADDKPTGPSRGRA